MKLNGRTVVLKGAFGSSNYNLFTKKEDGLDIEPSDTDCKLYVLPNFTDLYKGEFFHIEVVGEKEDYFASDIRRLGGMLYKPSINILEIFFTDDIYIAQGNFKDLNKLFDIKNDIVNINLSGLFGSCKGSYFRNTNNITNCTASSQYLVEKFGYNTKQALVAYRTIDFIERYHATGFTDFKKAMVYSDSERGFMLDIKTGKYTLEEFMRLATKKYTECFLKLEQDYCSKKTNDDLCNYANSIIKDVVYKNRLACLK